MREGLSVVPLDINVSTTDIEIMGICISQKNQKNINVLLVYPPPTGKWRVFVRKQKKLSNY